jgi:hypothetical protein
MAYHPIFPAALQPAALDLLHTLSAAELAPAMREFTVLVQGEKLSAPYRVYYEPRNLRSAIAGSTGNSRMLALCLGTRHWDGYIREECVRELVAVGRPWVVPFVVQLIGEYVVEIVEAAAVTVISDASSAQFTEFARENPAFMATTRRRVVSYWDCYYRSRFPTLQSYPPFIALDAITSL